MPTDDDKTPEERMREAFSGKQQPSFNWGRVLEVLKPGPDLGDTITEKLEKNRRKQ